MSIIVPAGAYQEPSHGFYPIFHSTLLLWDYPEAFAETPAIFPEFPDLWESILSMSDISRSARDPVAHEHEGNTAPFDRRRGKNSPPAGPKRGPRDRKRGRTKYSTLAYLRANIKSKCYRVINLEQKPVDDM
jgi:hypothetical protein